MKILFGLFITLISIQKAQAIYRPYVTTTSNGQQIYIVPQAVQPRKGLQGEGVVFLNSINFETVKDEQGQDVKKAWMYAGSCNKVYITDPKIFELTQGTMINVRMTQVGQCTVQSWQKF